MRVRVLINIAISSAMLSAVKFALSILPNIELVTLLIVVYASCLRLRETVAITTVFCLLEMLFFGASTWLISYILHWNLLGIAMWAITRVPIKNKAIKLTLITFVALVMTTLFGVISSLVDTGLFTGFLDDFWTRFGIIYLRGGYFYLAQIACNALVIPLLYYPIRKVYKSALDKFLSNGKQL